MIPVIYENLCAVCGKNLEDREISSGICSNKNISFSDYFKDEREEKFEKLFERAVGKLREIQKFWVRRLISGESFTTVAPTGIGKTTFGIIAAIFFAFEGKKSYIILPTTLLVEQCTEKIEKFCEVLGKKIDFCYYHKNLKKDEKEEMLEKISSGDFRILLTTTQFLSKRFNSLKEHIFDFVFIDDVDSILKNSRNVDKVLYILGFRKYKDRWHFKKHGILVVSTATAKKGKSTQLFRELLNFDVGLSFFSVRNIEDILVENTSLGKLKSILKRMGKGGILYAKSVEDAEKYYNLLKNEFRIGIVSSKRNKDYELFEKGALDYLIGTSYYYGTLIRGLDLPEKIRYVVFLGIPVVKLKFENIKPKIIKMLALIFRKDKEIEKYAPLLTKIEKYPEKFEELKKIIIKKLKTEKTREIVIGDNEIIFPDIKTYLQGSGRASRLTANGLTRGASFIFEENKELLNNFIKKISYYDIRFKKLKEINFENLIKEIELSRKKKIKAKDSIKPALFIVESPTKAKEISKFFGKPSIKILDGCIVYEIAIENYLLLITASLGHVVDLTTEKAFHGVIVDNFIPIYSTIKKCKNCKYQFTANLEKCPRCNSEIEDTRNRINSLRKLASQTKFVIIGTDPDDEGEKIAWDLRNLLSGVAEVKRAEFHEITPKAVKRAIYGLRDIDENIVKAQIVRRIEDRWIGFVLTQKLWRIFKNKNLSAGRVQTPVLKWIIEREQKFRKKKKLSYIPKLNLVLDEYIDKEKLDIEIKLKKKKREKKAPLPPYTTDELLRDANRILKLSSKDAMQLAQDLFEKGLITYHRTDSTYVSETGRKIASNYLGRDFKGRTWAKKGAHECIRPTRAIERITLEKMIYEGIIPIENLTKKHLALYDLIFRRFMASQCKEYNLELKIYELKYLGRKKTIERIESAKGKCFELYKSVAIEKSLPTGKFNVELKYLYVPEAYPLTQAEVVRLMKEHSIGRPSTYSTIIEKLFLRKYILERKNLLFPTKLGKIVCNFLTKNFNSFVSEERTKYLLNKMDEIENGKVNYREVLEEIYTEISQI